MRVLGPSDAQAPELRSDVHACGCGAPGPRRCLGHWEFVMSTSGGMCIVQFSALHDGRGPTHGQPVMQLQIQATRRSCAPHTSHLFCSVTFQPWSHCSPKVEMSEKRVRVHSQLQLQEKRRQSITGVTSAPSHEIACDHVATALMVV